jgi:hypothetical protein
MTNQPPQGWFDSSTPPLASPGVVETITAVDPATSRSITITAVRPGSTIYSTAAAVSPYPIHPHVNAREK